MQDIRYLSTAEIGKAILAAYPRLSFQLDPALIAIFHDCKDRETDPAAGEILADMLANARIAGDEHIPPCQDTGTQVFFVDLGHKVCLTGEPLSEVINQSVATATQELYLRRSTLKDPLFDRVNSGDNTPAIIHYGVMEGDKVRILMGQKGGGAENMSRQYMLKPDATPGDIVDKVVETVVEAGGRSCPPVIVGIGLGGNFELSALLSKRALFRELGSQHPDPRYADLEQEILTRLNQTGVGPQGLGGDTTALAVMIETAPCHIASLPLAINIQCHSHRHLTLWI